MIRDLDAFFSTSLSFYGLKIISVPLSIVYLGIIAKALGPQGYGELALVLGISHLVYYFAAAWSESAVLRFGREELDREGQLGRTVGTRAVLALACVAAAAVVLLLVRGLVARATGVQPAQLGLALVWALLFSTSNYAVYVLRVAGRIRQCAVASVLRYTAAVALSLPMALRLFPGRLEYVVAIDGVSFLVMIAYAARHMGGAGVWPLRPQAAQLRAMLRYCAPVVVIYVSGYVAEWGNVFVLNRFFTHDDIGAFNAFSRLLGHFNLLLMSLYTLVMPILVSVRTQQREDLVTRYIRDLIGQFSWAWVLGLLAFWAVAPVAVRILLGPDYAGHGQLLAILMSGVAFQGISILMSCLFLAYDYVRAQTAISVASELVITLVGMLMCARWVGTVESVAVAMVIARACGAGLSIWWAWRLFGSSAAVSLVFPMLLTGLVWMAGQASDMARALLGAGMLAGLVLLGRAIRLFKPEDLALLDRIDVPLLVRRRLAFLYR